MPKVPTEILSPSIFRLVSAQMLGRWHERLSIDFSDQAALVHGLSWLKCMLKCSKCS